MPRKKADTVEAVEADPIAPDMVPNEDADKDPRKTDWSKPISADNPPPSKRPLLEQSSPVSDGDVLQKDQREVDEDLKESEEDVADRTNSTARKTRTTDKNTGGTGNTNNSGNVTNNVGTGNSGTTR